MKKVYASYGYNGYAHPLIHSGVCELTDKLESADVVVFGGGADITPSIYGEKPGTRTYSDPHRCYQETRDFFAAKKLGIPMIGICRGMQLLTALHGGKIIQHVNNHATGRRHLMYFPKKKKDVFLQVNSLHHQMCLPGPEAVLLGYADGLSTQYLGQDDLTHPGYFTSEAEALYWPETNSFGVQWHPEMMHPTDPAVLWFVDQCKQVIQGNYNHE